MRTEHSLPALTQQFIGAIGMLMNLIIIIIRRIVFIYIAMKGLNILVSLVGLVIAIVKMGTMIKNVIGMEEIVVVIMS